MTPEEHLRVLAWEALSSLDKVKSIGDRLDWIRNRELYKDMRSRYSHGTQFEEEFKNHEEDLKKLWFSAKKDYCTSKEEIDAYLLSGTGLFSPKYLEKFNAMKKVIEDEVDNILLDEEE